MAPPPGSAHLNYTLSGGMILASTASHYGKLKQLHLRSLPIGLAIGGLMAGSAVLVGKNESFKGHLLASGVSGVATVQGLKLCYSNVRPLYGVWSILPLVLGTSIWAAGFAYNAKKAREWWPDKE
eukprot:CAMPEP_0194137560 /NCGR_PEP_ID=MMETSP0152-20130528/7456_1 /TAXON_ID=1049557 /ORGANISM="Thalassiothrix antarctica, Strain L6-D1" /LENGTH=124 /DNA_ID=CAMNT_0038834649 /DNA_START=60 /DNA_END=434 /DNA_ORIENTATION=-